VTTKSGNSAHIPKWKYADEMSFVHLNLHAMDAVIHLVDDKLSLLEIRDETDEEEFLQAESECDGTVEQEEQTPASVYICVCVCVCVYIYIKKKKKKKERGA
jgi:hypothetical protein